MLTVALDPGKVTGIATLYDGYAVAHELEPWYKAAFYIEETLLQQGARVSIVYESFTPRPGAYTWQPEALYLIGAVNYLANKARVPIESQTPAQAKAFSTDKKLKRVGWYKSTPGGHANDALRHLLLYSVRYGLLEPEELLESTS